MRHISRNITTPALTLLLLTPVLGVVEPRQWDTMKGPYAGTITVTTNTGKKLKRTGAVSFNPTDVTFVGTGVSVPRQDVRTVVIRLRRNDCCVYLKMAALPFLLRKEHELLPILILYSPVAVVVGAVAGPPELVIEGVRRLKPAKVLYKVVP